MQAGILYAKIWTRSSDIISEYLITIVFLLFLLQTPEPRLDSKNLFTYLEYSRFPFVSPIREHSGGGGTNSVMPDGVLLSECSKFLMSLRLDGSLPPDATGHTQERV